MTVDAAAAVGPLDERPTIRMAVGADDRKMSRNGIRLYNRRLDLLAVAAASPALWAPGLWLAAALIGVVVAAVVRALAQEFQPGAWGPASLVVLPGRLTLALLTAIPRLLGVAIGGVLSMVAGVVAVGTVAAIAGVLAGLAAHRDSGWLLWADAQSSIVAWAPRFGFALAAFLLARRALRRATATDRNGEAAGPPAGGPQTAVRSALDEIGELGLVGLAAGAAAAVLVFCQLPLDTWAPAPTYRSAAAGLHVVAPVNRGISKWVTHDVRVALEDCAPIAGFGDTVAVRAKTTTLEVTLASAAGLSPADVVAFAGARLANRIVPLPDSITIVAETADGKPLLVGTLPMKSNRDGVFRSLGAVAARFSPALAVTPRAAALQPLLESCKS